MKNNDQLFITINTSSLIESHNALNSGNCNGFNEESGSWRSLSLDLGFFFSFEEFWVIIGFDSAGVTTGPTFLPLLGKNLEG